MILFCFYLFISLRDLVPLQHFMTEVETISVMIYPSSLHSHRFDCFEHILLNYSKGSETSLVPLLIYNTMPCKLYKMIQLKTLELTVIKYQLRESTFRFTSPYNKRFKSILTNSSMNKQSKRVFLAME